MFFPQDFEIVFYFYLSVYLNVGLVLFLTDTSCCWGAPELYIITDSCCN